MSEASRRITDYYVERVEKVVLRFELCGALSRPSLFGVLAPHTGLQDDTQQTVSIVLLCRPALRQAHLVISQ